MQAVATDSVAKACNMVKSGKGKDISSFKGWNNGKAKVYNMKAKVYLSYYDTEQFPDVEQQLTDIKIPVLWVAGKQGRLTTIYNMEYLFENIPNNPKNKYLEIQGKHKSVLPNSSDGITSWTDNL